MARGKIQMERIESLVHRQVTFCKRRAGLLKEAKELSLLCDSEVGVFIFSPHGKLYELATKDKKFIRPWTMQGMIEKYTMAANGALSEQDHAVIDIQTMDVKKEICMSKREIKVLRQVLGFMIGGGSANMTLEELDVLEKYLELWTHDFRSKKMDILFQEIQLLRNKGAILQAANQYLQEKIEEKNAEVSKSVAMNNNTSHANYPLTIEKEERLLFQQLTYF